jgi:preprotein translocase subunit SecE
VAYPALRANGRSRLHCAGIARICPQPGKPKGRCMVAAINPLKFVQQVRAEVGKVTWPGRREVMLTTIMVFVMATLTSIFFFLVDLLIRFGLQGILGMFG